MSRPKSEDKRNAIMAAAIRVIAAQGLSAPTAMIAREAGVATGSLFNYFETKADLFNQLYLELKREVVAVAMDDFPASADLRQQAFHMWSRWSHWGAASPAKRKALAQLAVSDEITPESRAAAQQASARIADLLQTICAEGVLRDRPLAFVFAVVEALADTTMDFMIQQPAEAEKHCKAGFEALWRAIA